MSNLYIRVRTGFYSHRKTVKLRIKLGSDAFWIPPRLWSYAAEHQPDGDMSAYSSEEIAELLGCTKHATSILQALKDCGFIDESGVIHDWGEHNGYHEKFSIRAKKAAEARWSKEKSPTPSKERNGNRKEESGDKHCLTNACSITPEVIYQEYPHKVGKPDALRAISKALTKIDGERLLELTKRYAEARNGNRSYIPNPATWFNQERYNDDPSTWVRVDQSQIKTDKVW